MRYFIDLGTNDGKLLKVMIENYFKDFDKYIGFEPVPKLFNKAVKRLSAYPHVEIIKSAVSTIGKKNVKLYLNIYRKGLGPKKIGSGSTLMSSKKSGNIKKDRYIRVKSIDFSQYLINNFNKDDYIVVKIDIEGFEYKLLNHLIETGSISYIDKIICEWHHKKLKKVTKNEHYALVAKLQDLGFDLVGKNDHDDFSLRMIKEKKERESSEN